MTYKAVTRAAAPPRRRGRLSPATAATLAAAATAAAMVIAAAPATARAGNLWDGGGSNNDWTTNNNWNPNGDPANNATAPITFAGAVRLTPNLNNNWSIASLTFLNTAGAFTLGSSNGSTLTIAAGGIAQNDGDAQTINHALALGANQTWNAAAGPLAVNGPVNTGSSALMIDGDFATTLGGAVGGAGSLTKNGAATLTIAGPGANTFSGTTTVNAGTLDLAKTVANGALAGNLTIGDGSGSDVVNLLAAHQIGQAGNTVTINSSGTLQLNGFADQVNNVVFNGGQITTNSGSGALQLAGALTTNAAATAAVISGPGSLTLVAGNRTFTVADGAAAIDLDISTAIGQDAPGGGITKGGAGTLRLSGAGTYSGGLTHAAGMLILNHDAAAGTGTLTLAGGTLKTETSASLANAVTITAATTLASDGGLNVLSFNGAVGGAGALAVGGGAAAPPVRLRLAGTAANTHAGTVTVNNASLGLQKSAGVNAIGGDLVVGDHATGTLNSFVTPLAHEQIADAATVTVRRSGQLNLAELKTTETIGGLALEDGRVITGTGTLVVAGPITSSNVTPGAVSSVSGNLGLGGGTRVLTSAAGNTLNLDAVVSNGGISLQGDGTVHFNAANTFAGGFEHASGSAVTIGNDAALGTGTITTAPGATRTFASLGGPRTLANNFVLNAPTQFNLGSLTLSGTIAGSAGFSSSGGLRLGGTGNSYGGVTNINSGIVVTTADAALGATAAGTVVAPGATLRIFGDYPTPEPLTLSGNGVSLEGALHLAGAGIHFGGPIALAADTWINADFSSTRLSGGIATNGFLLTFTGFAPGVGAAPARISGPITGAAGPGLLLVSTVIFDGANNTYGGPTEVAGTLITAGGTAANNVPDTSPVVLRDGSILRLGQGDVEAIGSLTAGGALAAVELIADAELITGGDGTSTTFPGVISDPSSLGGGRLTKTGAGTMTLSGANTYRGVTTVAGGTLRATGGAAVSDVGAVHVGGGATFAVDDSETIGALSADDGLPAASHVTIAAGQTLTVTGGGRFVGQISGAGALAKGGDAPALVLRGTNTYTGRTTIDGGTIDVTADAALGQAPAAFVADHLTLDNGGTLHVGDNNGSPIANVAIPANRGVTIGPGGGRFQLLPGDTLAVASTLTGGGTLTVRNSHVGLALPVVTLGGANTTFTGKTVVDAAVLSVANDANLSAAPAAFEPDKLTLANGGTLRTTATMTLPANRGVTLLGGGGAGGAFEVNSGQTLTLASPIAGAGHLTKRGGGTLNFGAAANTYTGKTTLDAGTTIAQQDAAFGAAPAGPGAVADQLTIGAATLRWTASSAIAATRGVRLVSSSSQIMVDAGLTMTINSPLSGANGGLTKTGPGTLSLFGNNTYAGATSVGGGRLILNNSFATNTSFLISAGATLELAAGKPGGITLKTSSINATGKVDVKSNKLVFTTQPIGTWNGTAYTGVTGMVANAYAGGAWTGNGVTTTLPDAASGLTTLAVATAEQVGLTTFGGVSVAPSNVLVMYTYGGDTNFDGKLDADDYGTIDFNVLVPNARGYYNGDFNYDGAINADDYGVIDFNILAQKDPFPTGTVGGMGATSPAAPLAMSGVSAVPEPSAAACGIALLAGCLGRRRRHSAH